MTTLDYDRAPFLAIWETTQACDLSCKHCRASAQPLAHPSQLTTREAKNLIDQIADLQVPLFVFTGGDPLKRPDIFELISHAAGKGVHAALTPSATPLLTRDAIFRMKHAGLSRLAVSLDGSIPADSRLHPRHPRHVGTHRPGHSMGKRGAAAHPGPHRRQPPQHCRPRPPRRPAHAKANRHVELLLPRARRPRQDGRPAHRPGIRRRLRQNVGADQARSASPSKPPRRCTTAAT